MRVLLVSANREHLPDPIFPLGLAYIAAAVSQAGHELDVAAYPLNVDYLGLHREVVDVLHALSDAPVVLGGSEFSILPQTYMRELNGDWGNHLMQKIKLMVPVYNRFIFQ